MMLEFSSVLETVAWLPLRLSSHLLRSNPFHPPQHRRAERECFIHTCSLVGKKKKKMTEPLVEEFLNSGFAMYVTFAG